MKYIKIKNTDICASNIVMGCMHLSELSKDAAEKHIKTAMEQGINFFDHADVYDGGKCESLFAEAIGMNDDIREKMVLQSKVGIRRLPSGHTIYDFSREHLLAAVDASLHRLKTDYLDLLLLHRPDALVEPEEVAEAFAILHSTGKVRYFGVSNQNSQQVALLQKYVPYKLVVNQLQLSICHTNMIDVGIAVNMDIPQSFDRDGAILDYCRLNDMTIQAWSPFQWGFTEGVFVGDMERYPELNEVMDKVANKYGVTKNAIATGWIARHPANMQIILGTTNSQRLIESCQGSELVLTKEEWYEIYEAAGNMIP